MSDFIKGITLGDIAIAVAFFVALFAGIKALKKDIKDCTGQKDLFVCPNRQTYSLIAPQWGQRPFFLICLPQLPQR